MTSTPGTIKQFYVRHHDRISDKRYNSPYWLRRYAHRAIYEKSFRRVDAGQCVLDAGCGEGVLSLLMAEQGATVVGVDMSSANVVAARERCRGAPVDVHFLVGDAEFLPVRSSAFDVVVSSHVIEHLPDPDLGVRELARATRGHAVIAMPTCLNPAAWVLLGGDVYWRLTRRSLLGLLKGIARTLLAFIQRLDGPQEGYAGDGSLPHVFRFPWAMTRLIRRNGFHIDEVESGPLIIPYAASYANVLRLWQVRADRRLGSARVFRWLGYGTHVVASKAARSVDGADPGAESV